MTADDGATPVTGWQDISTAPSDSVHGKPPRLLLWVADADAGRHGKGRHAFGCVYEDGGQREVVAEGFGGTWKITHWMLLPPEPPK